MSGNPYGVGRHHTIDDEWAAYIRKNRAANARYAAKARECPVCYQLTKAESGICRKCRTEGRG